MYQKGEIKQRFPVRWIILAALLLFIWIVMSNTAVGEWYAQTIYPLISTFLSRLAAFIPFSVGDCFIYGSIVGLVFYLLISLIKHKNFWRVLRNIAEYLAWVYVWFYLAWGLNYFRQSFYQRLEITPVTYSDASFRHFLATYTDALNSSFCLFTEINNDLVDREIKRNYKELSDQFHIALPKDYQRGKHMLISPLMSAVGVRGYMGPFFSEYHLNAELQTVEWPSVYAHEMAHLLGISSEAEANLCSYLVCSRSDSPEIRFSGYFSILPYVVGNAHHLLPEEEYRLWIETLYPEIRQLYNDRNTYWQSRYSPWIGEAQDKIYNLFLKGNQISSGTANYSEVIALLMAYQQRYQ